MVEVITIAKVVLMGMRLILFALALGLTLISFQAYYQKGSKQLESAFIGFAFITMGVGLSNMSAQITENIHIYFSIVETIPFIIGFSMLYASLYR